MNFLISSKKEEDKEGFGLIETIVAVTLFTFISFAIYNGFSQLMIGLSVLEIKNKAINLANEKIEIARNLPYEDVGLLNGIPDGKLIPSETIEKENIFFNVETHVDNIDDPFDGTFDGDPQDESPSDYKLVQIDVSCDSCILEETITLYTKIAPQSIETGSENGALFLRVVDSYGQPLSGANISVYSDKSTTTVDINDVSDSDGYLKIYDVIPGIEAYEITVDKEGYSSEKTYTSGDPANPSPLSPHLNVLAGEITSASFVIDELSSLSLKTIESDCSSAPGVDFNLYSSNTIGENIYKNDFNLVSSGSGDVDLDELEWGDYYVNVTDSSYGLYGVNTIFPIKVNPNTNQDINLVVGPKDPNMLLVQVKDTATGLPLSDAQVTLSKDLFEETKTTGGGFINQTDWSGGPGQEEYVDETRFDSTNNNIDYSVLGQIVLDSFSGSYLTDGYLESSIIDLGTTSNFLSINWLNEGQPVGASAKFQIATNEIINATSTWDFVGPNGSGTDYYNVSGNSIYDGHSGDRYLKYKTFFESSDSSSTPLVSDINFTYSSGCTAPGQVIFTGLEAGTYQIRIERSGYETFEILDLEITEEWEILNAPMT